MFEGVVREVYSVDAWQPAATIPYTTRPTDELKIAGRWEFIGEQAPEPVRSRYLNYSVATYFKHGQQNPVVYVNV